MPDTRISIHTTRVGGDFFAISLYKFISISIHTTRVGGDNTTTVKDYDGAKFQSTPPVWVVTKFSYQFSSFNRISIHTTRVGGDYSIIIGGGEGLISIHTTRVGGDIDGNEYLPVQ